MPGMFICPPEQVKPVLIECFVIHLIRSVPKVRGLHLFGSQQVLLYKLGQVDEIGIARKGGKRLVGAVSIACGPDGEHLPVPLAGRRQKLDKPPGFFSQRSDPEWRREAENRQ